MREILSRLSAAPGSAALYYRPLDGDGEAVTYRADEPFVAASVIKLPIMIEAFRQIEAGLLDPEGEYVLRPEQKLPPCGVLTFLHDGLRATLMDLVTLMIIVSDNTATNMVIDIVGIDNVNRTLRSCGATGTILRRRLFDREASARGVQNEITARDIGRLLEGLYHGTIVSPAASRRMLDILKAQQLNGKIPFFLDCEVAHKTGEDDGITHDAGIVYAPRPFVLCLFSERTDVPAFERLIQDAGRRLYALNHT
ncbi:MAG: serine hydrolase [Clostridia bacterium]|nr:serine hydrolase [Clostridia bacterium]